MLNICNYQGNENENEKEPDVFTFIDDYYPFLRVGLYNYIFTVDQLVSFNKEIYLGNTYTHITKFNFKMSHEFWRQQREAYGIILEGGKEMRKWYNYNFTYTINN